MMGKDNINPIRYRSYYFDTDLGLYYLHSRYYDANTCRFINADDVSVLTDTQIDINGLNLYMYCANNPIRYTDNYGTNFLHDLWNGIKNVWDVVVGAVVSAACVVAGVALTIVSGGALYNVGFGLIGAGVGSFIGGMQSKQNGNSFWSGYLGGLVAGGMTGAGVSAGPLWAFFAGSFGNFFGTITTDALNGMKIDTQYLANLTGKSLISGIISTIAYKVGKLVDIFKAPGFRDIYSGLVVLFEFIFNGFTNDMHSFFENMRYRK